MSLLPDEFEWIDRLKPLTRGDERAGGLMDDAAALPTRAGYDLIVSADALVEGVHFPVGAPGGRVAKRLLRTSLSDLAAKAAEPFGYFLTTAWPDGRAWADRDAFIQGLSEDGARFDVSLLGGDTVRSKGGLMVNALVLGWTPSGAMIPRSGARAGDVAVVCGHIGDGWLGLEAVARGADDQLDRLAAHYWRPEPLFGLRDALRRFAHAAADVSDGLVADLGHIASASGLGLRVALSAEILSVEGRRWLAAQASETDSLAKLAGAGDDYAIVCAVAPAEVEAFRDAAETAGIPCVAVGRFVGGQGIEVFSGDRRVLAERWGYRH